MSKMIKLYKLGRFDSRMIVAVVSLKQAKEQAPNQTLYILLRIYTFYKHHASDKGKHQLIKCDCSGYATKTSYRRKTKLGALGRNSIASMI